MKLSFKKGEQPIYDHEQARAWSYSFCNEQGGGSTVGISLNDRTGCMAALYQLRGDDKGLTKNAYREIQPSKITAIQRELELLTQRWEGFRHSRLQMGRRDPGEGILENGTPELREEYLKLTARMDVALEEVRILEKKIAEFDQVVEEQVDLNLCKNGPLGSGRLREGVLCEIDFCKVLEVDGRLLLMTGPYTGLQISDYMYVVDTFHADRKKADKERLIRAQEQARANFEPIPKSLPFRARGVISQSSLPAWPTDPETGLPCRNWLKPQAEPVKIENKVYRIKK